MFSEVEPCVCPLQSREGVGRWHPGAVTERSEIRLAQAGGGPSTHQELEVFTLGWWNGCRGCLLALKELNWTLNKMCEWIYVPRILKKVLSSQ